MSLRGYKDCVVHIMTKQLAKLVEMYSFTYIYVAYVFFAVTTFGAVLDLVTDM